MKNYRIKKVTNGDTTKYYPQERNMRTLWGWEYVFDFDDFFAGGYDTLEEARKRLCEYCRKPVIEYFDFDPERDCK